jgi:hypothetical protein
MDWTVHVELAPPGFVLVTARPRLSTATQSVVEAHEIPEMAVEPL